MSELVATEIVPFVASGFAGSKSIDPEIPSADPLIDSTGAVMSNERLLTPLGSVKSKVAEPAKTLTAKERPAIIPRMRFII